MSDLRDLERDSIRAFVQSAADEGYLSGRVLDYGCGKQPYRDIVEAAGGEYHGFDQADFPANVSGEDVGSLVFGVDYDTALCTQVLQYVAEPVGELLANMRHYTIRDGGHLIFTYPTNWPEVEPEDLHRFTKAGMERLLTEAGFEIIKHEPRGFARFYDEGVPPKQLSPEWLAFGYGCIARA